MKFNNFNYKYSKDLGIQVIHNKILPSKFYKYYALNEYSVDALTRMYIYVSDPAELNDPFDCCKDLIDFDDIESMKAMDPEIYEQICKIYPDIESRKDFYINAYQNLIYKKCGILSLTDTYLYKKIWALYTQNRGFCVEFNISEFPFRYYGPFPINYVEHLEKKKVSEYGVPTLMAYQSNVKEQCWSDENEWRLLVPCPDGFNFLAKGEGCERYNFIDDLERKMRYPLSAVTCVILAPDFFADSENQIVSKFEYEIISRDPLKCRLLDFLSDNKILIKPLIAEDFHLKSLSVRSYKLDKGIYRLR